MKLLIPSVIFVVALACANAEEPKLNQTSIDASIAQRIAFIERHLQIRTVTWDLVLPNDYSASLVFRQGGSDKPTLELSFDPGSTNPLLFASSPDGDGMIGLTMGGQERSTTIFIPKSREMKTAFAQLDGVKNINLVEVFTSADAETPQVWVELRFHKK